MASNWRTRTVQVQGPPGPPGSTAKGSSAWTPGTVANGAFASVTVAVVGSTTGMPAAGAFSLALPAGVILGANVTAAGVVTVSLFNMSGGPVTVGAGTVTAEVLLS